MKMQSGCDALGLDLSKCRTSTVHAHRSTQISGSAKTQQLQREAKGSLCTLPHLRLRIKKQFIHFEQFHSSHLLRSTVFLVLCILRLRLNRDSMCLPAVKFRTSLGQVGSKHVRLANTMS